MRFRGLLAALLAVPCIGLGQVLTEADITGQPLVYLKEGTVHGCGVRLFAFELDPTLQAGYGWDGSFSLWSSGFATIKGLAYDLKVADITHGRKPQTAPIDRIWIKAPNFPATQPRDNKIIPGEDKDSILYVIDIDSALNLMEATMRESTLTVGIKRRGESGERLYFGVPKMTLSEKQQLLHCMREVARSL